ncbi:MAG: N-acyl homoserine lactonase family protein [Gammaproteobacteria bacterium]|nr:N-acyl homoserine lactonase family protein [Gammaproteobacteria bacterium]
MTQVKKFWPLLTGTHQYEKTLSTRGRGHGKFIHAPILAYLIETTNGRILYDVGCDYEKINNPLKRKLYYENESFPFGPPVMTEEQQLKNRLARLGLSPLDVDLVFVSHLHFDHGGGLKDMCHADIHVHHVELAAAKQLADDAYFEDDFNADYHWRLQHEEYDLLPGVRAIESPGHTAGHMSMMIELPKGPPIILAGDAADLQENITDEIAPGLCWNNQESMAIDSIRKLKHIASDTGSQLWPNHDIEFYRQCHPFPMHYE